MPVQLSKGHTYNPGDVVDAADLNALVDNASALSGLISEATSATAASADQVLILKSGALRRAAISTIPIGVTSVAFDAGYPQPVTVLAGSVLTGTADAKIRLSMPNQVANKVLASPATGTGVPSFRPLAPTDIPIATVTIGALDFNWDLGVTFKKSLAANSTFTFSNANEGQTIRVLIIQDASHTVAWNTTPAVRWPGGTVPVMTTGAGRVDIYTFSKIGGVFYGMSNQNFL